MQVVGGQAGNGGGAGFAVAPALRSLLPGGLLGRGTAVSVPDDLPLLLALASVAADQGGGWAAVGLPGLGALAARGAGLDLGTGMWIDAPGRRWPEVVATVLEAAPVVLLGPLGRVPERAGRRLEALLRRSGAVLLVAGPWPRAQLRLQVTEAAWEGVGRGHGVLVRRRARVVVSGRGAAAGMPQAAWLWLPGGDGSVSVISESAPVEQPARTAGLGVAPGGRAVGG